LSNELGEPELFGQIHEIIHSLACSREAKTSERVILSWVMMTAGKVLSGEWTGDRIQADQKG
jgi:hypothetical protein